MFAIGLVLFVIAAVVLFILAIIDAAKIEVKHDGLYAVIAATGFIVGVLLMTFSIAAFTWAHLP